VTARKPPGLSFESWIDRQVREAQERGEFQGLSGHGKPIADIDEPYDEQWWVRRKLRDEGVSYLPPSLALRKEAEVALEAAAAAPTEAHARRIVEDLNAKIRAAIRLPPAGPPLNLFPYDVEAVLADRRSSPSPSPSARAGEAGPDAGADEPPDRGGRRRVLRRGLAGRGRRRAGGRRSGAGRDAGQPGG
jgi:hypothetical protein